MKMFVSLSCQCEFSRIEKMRKIRCKTNANDFIKVHGDGWVEEGECAIELHADSGKIILSPAKIRKLRKQLKRALIEIEGEQDELYDYP